MENSIQFFLRSVVTVLMTCIGISVYCQTKEETNNMNIAEKVERITPEIAKNNRIMYAIHLNTRTPYELYFDDILISHNHKSDFVSRTKRLNTYLFRNGKYKVKLRFLPLTDSKDSLVHPNDIFLNDSNRWEVYFAGVKIDNTTPVGYSESIDYDSSKLTIVAPPHAVPVWEQEFEVEVNHLPYSLEGWSESEDLRNWDQEELEKAVVAYYELIRDKLNKNEINEVQRMFKRAVSEIFYVNYIDDSLEEFIVEDYEDIKMKWGGKMIELKDYYVNISSNGKLVQLKVKNKEHYNWGALIGYSEEMGSRGLSIIIHKPKNSDSFEIIRLVQ
ncbi:MAG: hypothetical protein LBI72_13765 [Flavobacteriaceae bacterium]|jgi:hypothetical protein|nr:hypothetical protein [Flavobacteriaceae bacterium]